MRQSGTLKEENSCVIFLDDGCDFEQQLINDDFIQEIKNAFISLKVYYSEEHRNAQEARDIAEINNYSNENLYEKMCNAKTTISPIVANKIVDSNNGLPSNIITLFEKINTILKINEVTA